MLKPKLIVQGEKPHFWLKSEGWPHCIPAQHSMNKKLCRYVPAAGMLCFTGTWLLAAALGMPRNGLSLTMSETDLRNS